MSILQLPVLLEPEKTAPRATRPFTRTHNDLYDKVKPNLRHKVDRSVLDAVVRRLEGFHQAWVTLTIAQLASLAGVSPWSTTKALGRLTEAGILLRRPQLLTQSGRFVWELALTDPYRVMAGVAPLEAADTPAPAPASSELRPEEPAELAGPAEADNSATEPPLPRAAALATMEPVLAPEPPTPAVTSELETAPVEFTPAADSETARQAPPAEPSAAPEPASRRPAPLTPEQALALEHLRSVGVDLWKARKTVFAHPPEEITRAVEALKHRTGTVRNPAAWIVRELERGGYAPPPALVELEKRQQEQARKALQKLQAEEHQAELARLQDEGNARLLQAYQELPSERQRELEHQVREQLRRVSPRLAMAPLDLTSPGPLRSELLELLQKLEGVGSGPGVKVAGPTPRAGGWAQRRAPEPSAFSHPLQEPRSSCATNEL